MRTLKSAVAVIAGISFIVISHTVTDRVLEGLGIFPPAEEGLHVTWMLLVALAYRAALSVVGCYITAALAPSRPMLHALVLGLIGVITSIAGTFAAVSQNLGPVWYPISLAVLSIPCAFIGGKLAERRSPAHS